MKKKRKLKRPVERHLKGRFFQVANSAVDCVCEGPPSLEFPVREEARSELRAGTRGVGTRKEPRGRGEEVATSGSAVEHRSDQKARERHKETRKMGESSPDLSLRLRQGSSDSRDSFYMDFAQVCQ